MAKKTWIKVKRGILEPKHRRKLGQAWYLYLYMLDLTNWEDGIIYDWKDKDVAADMEIPINTLRDHRRKLEDELYIKTKIKKYGLEITINNWTNPREYSGEVYNQIEGNEITEPCESEGYTESDTESDTESTEKLTPLHLIHSITESHNHIPQDVAKKIEKHREIDDYLISELKFKKPNKTFYNRDWVDPIAEILGLVDFDIKKAKAIIKKTVDYMDLKKLKISSPASLMGIIRADLGEIERRGNKPKGREFNPLEVISDRAN